VEVVDRELLALHDQPDLPHDAVVVDDVVEPAPLPGVGEQLGHLLTGDVEVDVAGDAAAVGHPLHRLVASVVEVLVGHGS
jgi:hypothetical protein